MKGLLILTIVALVSLAAGADPDCSAGHPDHQPHPTDCSLYYTCSNGIAILQECPPGLWWSVEMDTCDLPGNTICNAASTTTATTPTTVTTPISTTTKTMVTTTRTTTPTPTPTTRDPPTEGTTNTGTTTRTTTTAAPTTTTPAPTQNKCPPVEDPEVIVRFPHETVCAFYYRCEKGKPVLYTCQPTDHFSPTKRVCIRENAAGCDSCPVEEDVTEVVRLPHEDNCHFYYLCQAGKPNLYQCKEDLHFSRSDRECMSQSEAKCTLGQRYY